MADTVHTPIELHLFTDMQKANMPGNFSELALPANVTLVLHPVVNSRAELDGGKRECARPGVGPEENARSGRDRRIQHACRHAQWFRWSSTATRSPRAALQVPASGRATVEFDSLDVPYGFSRCEVKIDSADASARRRRKPYSPSSARTRARSSSSTNRMTPARRFISAPRLRHPREAAFTLQSVTVEQAANQDPSKYAFVVLSDVARGSVHTRKQPRPLRSRRRKRSGDRRDFRLAIGPKRSRLRQQHSRLAVLFRRRRGLPHRGRNGPVASVDGQSPRNGRA